MAKQWVEEEGETTAPAPPPLQTFSPSPVWEPPAGVVQTLGVVAESEVGSASEMSAEARVPAPAWTCSESVPGSPRSKEYCVYADL